MKNLPEKIKNLEKIKRKFIVPKFIYFRESEFKKNKEIILKKISKFFTKKTIIRSASFQEDNEISNAGKFLSIPNISSKNNLELEISIEKVFKSYKNKKSTDQYLFVQEYIDNADEVGVIFTADTKNSAPFRTINFNSTNDTSLITSGKSNGKIIYYFKNSKEIIKKNNLQKMEKVISNLENIFPNQFLDIEFLVTKKKIKILQVRNLYTDKIQKINFTKHLKDLEKKILKMTKETSQLIGKNRYFSTMTDWNPAEIIGLKPKTLALTMYKSLITDTIWSESRKELGYKDINKMPLLYSFLGTPFIDLRTDINSFLLDKHSENLQKKLIKFYFNEFKKKPYFYYDKIESKLVINCISLNSSKYRNILSKSNLNKREINIVINDYKELTENIILKLSDNIKKYKLGEKLFLKIKKSKNSTINKIFLLHNVCKNYGTLPFANIARMAFVGVEFLNSMSDLKIINNDEKKIFLESIHSISTEMKILLKQSKKSFLNKFGHLRPNTYEISNKNYKENYSIYFKNINKQKIDYKKFYFSKKQIQLINKNLNKEKFRKIDARKLINFIKKSITEREASKLFFTKIIDEIFSQLKILSDRIELDKRLIKHLDIYKILEFYEKFSHEDLDIQLKKDAFKNKKSYSHNQNYNLPNIIINKEDIYLFEENQASPTFITNKEVLSKFIHLKNISNTINLDNKIVCIENADPGFDFVFSHKIKGLITAFGGPNSHMSIRCNEFGIPAAIGVGDKKFQQLINYDTLFLDCKKKVISTV